MFVPVFKVPNQVSNFHRLLTFSLEIDLQYLFPSKFSVPNNLQQHRLLQKHLKETGNICPKLSIHAKLDWKCVCSFILFHISFIKTLPVFTPKFFGPPKFKASRAPSFDDGGDFSVGSSPFDCAAGTV